MIGDHFMWVFEVLRCKIYVIDNRYRDCYYSRDKRKKTNLIIVLLYTERRIMEGMFSFVILERQATPSARTYEG